MFLVSVLVACGNDCSYYARCDGDTLLQCGAGVDQQFGRQVYRYPCDAPNPVCVELGDSDATCAVSADACEEGANSCDGDVALTCSHLQAYDGQLASVYDEWLPTATDCAQDGGTCAVDPDSGGAYCASGA